MLSRLRPRSEISGAVVARSPALSSLFHSAMCVQCGGTDHGHR